MLLEGFIATSDSSINGPEFKSPIFYGTNAISAFTPSIDELINSGNLSIDFHENGTHTHVGHVTLLNSLTMSYIRRFYHSLFVPLCEEMKNAPVKTDNIFGRYFVYYADMIDNTSNSMEHRNFINVQHSNTLEFRIVQYHNATQYDKALKLCRKIATIVFNDFCAFVIEKGYFEGQTLNPEQKQELKDVATKTGKKLAKAFQNFEE